MGATAVFEVKMRGSSARLMLMDADNYQAYLDDEPYTFYGGYTDTTPAHLEIPYDGHWYLVLDSNQSRIKVWVKQVFD